MTDYFVRSTDGSDTDTGLTWALAWATAEYADNNSGNGDTVFYADAHSESGTGAKNYELGAGATQYTEWLVVDDTGDPANPTTLATGALLESTDNSVTVLGSGLIHGFTLSSYGNLLIGDNNQAAGRSLRVHNCQLKLNRVGSTAPEIRFGIDNGAECGRIEIKDCSVYFGTSGQALRFFHGDYEVIGLSAESGTQTPDGNNDNDVLVRSGDILRGTTNLVIRDSDLSVFAADLVLAPPQYAGNLKFINCKMPASWTGGLSNGTLPSTYPASRKAMYNCTDGTTDYTMSIETFGGRIDDETAIYRNNATNNLSWKFVTDGNASENTPVISDPIHIRNTTTGSSVTVTCHFLHDSLTALTDAEIWIEADYYATSGSYLGTFTSDQRADVLTGAAPQATSSEVWTESLTNDNEQQCVLTFTPQVAGYLEVKVHVAKASYTIYVCPEIELS